MVSRATPIRGELKHAFLCIRHSRPAKTAKLCVLSQTNEKFRVMKVALGSKGFSHWVNDEGEIVFVENQQVKFAKPFSQASIKLVEGKRS